MLLGNPMDGLVPVRLIGKSLPMGFPFHLTLAWGGSSLSRLFGPMVPRYFESGKATSKDWRGDETV